MTKERISATVNEKTVERIENLLKSGKYRNKSHVIEEGIRFLEEEETKKEEER